MSPRFKGIPRGLLPCLGILLSLPLLLFAAQRPAAPKVKATYASPLKSGVPTEGPSEGERFLEGISSSLKAQLNAEGRVLLPEVKSKDGDGLSGEIRALALFQKSKEDTFELIIQPSQQALYLPRLKSSAPVLRSEGGELTEFHLGFGIMDIEYRTQHWWWPSLSRIEWGLDSTFDNDIKVAKGFWQLYALGPDRCLGEYGTVVDTGLPVPESMQGYFARKDIPDALKAFQRYIDSGGRYRREK